MPTSPRKGLSARLRREAEIELRSSARLSSPRNFPTRGPHRALQRDPLPKPISFSPSASARTVASAAADERHHCFLAPPRDHCRFVPHRRAPGRCPVAPPPRTTVHRRLIPHRRAPGRCPVASPPRTTTAASSCRRQAPKTSNASETSTASSPCPAPSPRAATEPPSPRPAP